MVKLYPVFDGDLLVFCQADPRKDYPELVIDEFAGPADYPSGEFQVLGRKSDDHTVFRAFRDETECEREGFDRISFTIVPDWDHYCDLFPLSR